MPAYSFLADKEYSSHQSEESYWDAILLQAFPAASKSILMRADGTQQRRGMDRAVVDQEEKALLIDEVVRRSYYGDDIALEVIDYCPPGWATGKRYPAEPPGPGDLPGMKPGKFLKELYCDYVGYIIPPARKGWFLPFGNTQAWVRRNWAPVWSACYTGKDGHRMAPGTTSDKSGRVRYETLSLVVPCAALMDAIPGILPVSWEETSLESGTRSRRL